VLGEMMKRNQIKFSWRRVIFALILIVFLFCFTGIFCALSPFSNRFLAGQLCYWSIENGNAQSALFWANCEIRKSPDRLSYKDRAMAYELAGKYEKSLEDYNMAEQIQQNSKYSTFYYYEKGRTYYKMGRKLTAYEYYMKGANEDVFIKQFDGHDRQTQYYRKMYSNKVKARICGKPEFWRLNPYKSFDDFVQFMEEEHAKYGSRQKHENNIKKLREIVKILKEIE
jgi:tetratricopeptide (TPR) repeat protein